MNLSVTANIHEEVWCLLETKGTSRKKGWDYLCRAWQKRWSWRRLTILTIDGIYNSIYRLLHCVSIKETSPFTTGEKLYSWGGRRMYHLRNIWNIFKW